MVDINVTIENPEDINVSLAEPEEINVTLEGGITGASQLNHLTDVTITSPQDTQHLIYNGTSEQWENTAGITSVAWGDLTGTLSNQTDLQTALDLKEEDLTFSTGLTRTTNTITINNSEITLTSSQISDFDTEVSNNTSVLANTDKVTNATHTGDVTGDTSLSIEPIAVTGQNMVTAIGTDYVLISDTSDTSNLKKALISDFYEKNENFTLDSVDISNKYVTIAGTINDSQTVHLFIENIGIMAEVGVDFSYSGNNVYWTGYELENTLEIGDKLRVFYT